MANSFRRFRLRFLKKMTFLPSKIYAKYSYEYFTGKKLDLNNPTEFNAKIQWYKVYFRPKILNQLVDKYEVRKYVAKKIGEKYLNEIYGVYHKVSEINFEKFPDSFVIKGVHASSYNMIVPDKSKLNKTAAKKKFNKWLRTNQYYRSGQEWAYKDVVPKLMAEKILNQEGKSSLTDYKFYCFDGVPKFAEIHLDRAEKHKRCFVDLDFKKLPFRYVSIEKTIQGKTLQTN